MPNERDAMLKVLKAINDKTLQQAETAETVLSLRDTVSDGSDVKESEYERLVRIAKSKEG